MHAGFVLHLQYKSCMRKWSHYPSTVMRTCAAYIKNVTLALCMHCVKYPLFSSIQINNSGHDSSPAPLASVSASSSSAAASSKWACAMCTYLNWPKAHKCVQCYTVRKRVSPSSMSPRSATPSSAEQHSVASMNKAFEQVILSSTQVSHEREEIQRFFKACCSPSLWLLN